MLIENNPIKKNNLIPVLYLIFCGIAWLFLYLLVSKDLLLFGVLLHLAVFLIPIYIGIIGLIAYLYYKQKMSIIFYLYLIIPIVFLLFEIFNLADVHLFNYIKENDYRLVMSTFFYMSIMVPLLLFDIFLRGSLFGQFKITVLLLGLIQFCLLTFTVFLFYSVAVQGRAFTSDQIFTIYQTTDLSQISEYLSNENFIVYIAVFAVIIIFINVKNISKRMSVKLLSVLLFASIFSSFLPIAIVKNGYPFFFSASLISGLRECLEELKEFNEIRENRVNSVAIAKATEENGIHIVVFGESHNRKHMGAYGYNRNTTPWLSEMIKNNKNFLLYKNVFGISTASTIVFKNMLTEMNQYYSKEFKQSVSLLEVLKSAGYKTAWISNTTKLGPYSTIISALASTADYMYWADGRTYFSITALHDETVLPFLISFLAENSNEINSKIVIFIHFYGNHVKYKNRYPEDFSWMEEQEFAEDIVGEYDTTVLYVDYVLSKIFDIAKQNKNVKTMTYLSDHGEDVTNVVWRTSNTDKATAGMISVPMFTWFSDEYLKSNQFKTGILKSRSGIVFTNDIFYDTFIGMLGIETEFYNKSFDLSNRDYSFPEPLTFAGKLRVRDLLALDDIDVNNIVTSKDINVN